MKEYHSSALRWSICLAGLTALFWAIWSIFAPVPEMKYLTIGDLFWRLPFSLSCWYLAAAVFILTAGIANLLANPRLKPTATRLKGSSVLLMAGLFFGAVIFLLAQKIFDPKENLLPISYELLFFLALALPLLIWLINLFFYILVKLKNKLVIASLLAGLIVGFGSGPIVNSLVLLVVFLSIFLGFSLADFTGAWVNEDGHHVVRMFFATMATFLTIITFIIAGFLLKRLVDRGGRYV
jgi:MFS family permease